MSADKTMPARKRSATGDMLERAWWRDHRELLARGRARLPPTPDARRRPREFAKWMQKHAQSELSPEWKQLFDDLQKLPRIKYSFRKARDREIASWLIWLQALQQWGAPFDLRTCKLGANPENHDRPSHLLRCLTAAVARKYPNVNEVRLFYAIRNWRKSVSTI